jgi:hypothetical protein
MSGDKKSFQTPYIGDNDIDRVLANIYDILNALQDQIGNSTLTTEGFTGIITFVE